MIILVLIGLQICTAAMAAEKKTWFSGKEDGWFFYKEKPAPPKLMPEEPRTHEPSIPSSEASKPAHQRIKEHGERLLGHAMVNPTEENVRAYMIYQKAMLDGADRFSKVWERVLAKNPDLYLKNFSSEGTSDDISKNIKILAKEAGIFFFFRSDCPHCHKQVFSIKQLQERYGFRVLAVSLDGGVIPELQSITKVDNGISQRVGIKAVPAIYLAFPEENRFEPISQGGYLSIIDIERRLSQYVQVEMAKKDDIFGIPGLSADLNDLVPR